MSFFHRLSKKNIELNTQLCVGLDFVNAYETTIKTIRNKVSSIKIQSAFFEVAGQQNEIKRVVDLAHKNDLEVILDYKRCDIGSTVQAYIDLAFKDFNADAITIVPYMGLGVLELLKPWIDKGKGVYVVWASSNEDAHELQKFVLKPVLDLVENYDVGLVLGATKVNDLEESLFKQASKHPFLLPGFGAQGAVIQENLFQTLKSMKSNLFPVSRAIFDNDSSVMEQNIEKWADYFKVRS